MRRVTRGRVVVLTCNPELVQRFWLNHYAPEVLAVEARRYPSLRRIGDLLGGEVSYHSVPIPLHCRDGFNEALLRTTGATARSAGSIGVFGLEFRERGSSRSFRGSFT